MPTASPDFTELARQFAGVVRQSPGCRYRLICTYADADGNELATVTHELAASVSMVLPGTAEEVETAERALRVASAMQAIDALVRNAPLALAPLALAPAAWCTFMELETRSAGHAG